jgi:RNA-binding protein
MLRHPSFFQFVSSHSPQAEVKRKIKYTTPIEIKGRTLEHLTPKQRKDLKAKSHHLNPVVIIGDKGLTKAVLTESSKALDAHELIKVKINIDDRIDRKKITEEMCNELSATKINEIGKVCVIYREKPTDA